MMLDSDVTWSNWRYNPLCHASYLHFIFVIDLLSISKVIIFYTIATDDIYQNAANCMTISSAILCNQGW